MLCLQVFIPRLLELLEQGKNDSAVFQLLVQFIVMVYPGHQSLLQPIMPTLLAVILNRLTAAFIEAIEATVDHPEAIPGLELPGNSSQSEPCPPFPPLPYGVHMMPWRMTISGISSLMVANSKR